MAAFSLNPSQTLTDTLFGRTSGTSAQQLLRSLLLVTAGSLFIALSAQLAIRLPFSPVPVTGQTFAVLIVGMAFGSRLGALTVLAYLAEGLFLPVFAEARTWFHPVTPWTAGYLVGFVAAAYVTGWLAENGWDRRPLSTAAAMVVGNLAIYVPGMLWLSYMFASNTDLAGMALASTVFIKGFSLFLIGDLAKIILAVVAFPAAWKFVNRKK